MATATTTRAQDEDGHQTVDVVTPSAGESVTEGTVLEWHFKVGDPIKVDQTIVEISTHKVDVELPAPASGTVSEILVEEGATVTVGQVIARISLNGAVAERETGDASGAQAPSAGGSAADTEPSPTPPTAVDGANGAISSPAPAAADGAGAPAASGQTIDVLTPAAGESVSEGTILEWRVAVGDFIKANETIVEISTDKVDLEIPSPASGTVSEILVEPGETVTVGQVIARVSVGAPAPAPAPAAAADGDGATERHAAGEPRALTAELPESTKVSPVAARAAAAE